MRVFIFPCLLLVLSFLGIFPGGATAQTMPTELNLVARYTFDGNFGDATGDSANNGVPSGVPEFACGINGSALALNSGNDFVRIPGGNSNNVNRRFESEDFTLSFYFKSIGTNGTQYLVSKRDTNCNNLQFIAIRYAPLTRTISAVLRQNNQEARVDHRITNAACWQHVVLLREGNSVRLFLNAREVGEARTSSRVDVDNTGDFLIGSTNCRTPGETPFDGLIDEMRIYSRALRDAEVEGLYERPDRIVNTTRRLFLGESVDIELNSACGVGYDWLPRAGVDDPSAAEPTITPVAAGRQAYRVRIQDAESNCTAIDSIVLQVIDPALLDCSQIFLPKAFTPNGIGPTENETFGISNPFAISELVSFEIYDRYGAQMFQTTDAFARWDGTFKGSPVHPGVAVWRVVYRCQGNEFVESGSVMVMR
ncbi:gliding motility-associated C-terminal domain-containing protein [Neolewinella lacunae]|uniref:Gliding motility-associated C-terminal domain-containing protein n=1 Tax=Neolewinella lacunae TaxID=1517758 RepID=A0A923PHJ6_9BACT|nr:LamG-like jellyroll fold domain-containing protein [Neolewinella lacunae]MBC6992735.1 gliding motility-associated C-terminal domain-containing protein [Neolewinella lacunae]MDN3635979.1 gliding motility-associated C-terminal domain-containing protein [Neolewinella lacunae]